MQWRVCVYIYKMTRASHKTSTTPYLFQKRSIRSPKLPNQGFMSPSHHATLASLAPSSGPHPWRCPSFDEFACSISTHNVRYTKRLRLKYTKRNQVTGFSGLDVTSLMTSVGSFKASKTAIFTSSDSSFKVLRREMAASLKSSFSPF